MDISTQQVEFLGTQRTIFHYTKLKTLLCYILPNMTLRLQSNKNVCDPFEKENRLMSSGGFRPRDPIEYERFRDKVENVQQLIENDLNTRVRQLSFCKNSRNLAVKDSLGLLRMRMWDQYGEKFCGVCLAFNKEGLFRRNSVRQRQDWFYSYVRYCNFQWLEQHREHLEYQLFYQGKSDREIAESHISGVTGKVFFLVSTQTIETKENSELAHFQIVLTRILA